MYNDSDHDTGNVFYCLLQYPDFPKVPYSGNGYKEKPVDEFATCDEWKDKGL
jgi:hypothetical protein